MAKLTDFKLPTGGSGNIFSIKDWTSLILGGFVLIITFATAQHLVSKVPKNKLLDTQLDKPWVDPVASSGTKKMVF